MIELFSPEWLNFSYEEKRMSLYAATSYERLNVAIFEKDPKNIEILTKLVEDLGMSAKVFTDGQVAHDAIPTFGLEIVFVISGMSLKTEIGKLLRLRILEFTNDMPFLFVTDNPEERNLEEVIKSVTKDYLEFYAEFFEPSQILDLPIKPDLWVQFLQQFISSRLETINNEVKNRLSFIEIARKSLVECEELILSIEKSSDPVPLVNSLFGHMHTLKGGSSFLQPRSLEKFLHKYEDYINQIRNGYLTINDNVISVLLRNLDEANRLVRSFIDGNCIFYNETELEQLFSTRQNEKIEIKADSENPSPKDSNASNNSTNSTNTNNNTPINNMTRDQIFEKKSEAAVNVKSNASPNHKNAETEQGRIDKGIKIPISFLDNLMQISGEQTVLRNMISKLNKTIKMKFEGDTDYAEMYALLEELHKLNTQIQGQILELRKVSPKEVFSSLNRVVRDASKMCGKLVEFKIIGADNRIDTGLTDVLGNTIIHLIRNSIDHGLEFPQEREVKGKPKAGQLVVEISLDKNNVYVQIKDDGKGLQTDIIKARALKNGLISTEQADLLQERDIWNFIFAPGFSTAEKITDISGRGIGMSAVKESVESIGGNIYIESNKGKGSAFILTLPIPKSVFITRCLFVKINNSHYGIMIDNILRILHLNQSPAKYKLSEFGGSTILTMNELNIPVLSMDEILENKKYQMRDYEKYQTLIVLRSQKNGHIGIFVDSVFEFEDTVVKEFSEYFHEFSNHFKSINIFFGTSYLGDGSAGLIINVDGIINYRVNQSNWLKSDDSFGLAAGNL